MGLLPLAYGVGAGADMLRPMAVAVIGSLFMSLVMSLLATPLFFYLMVRSLSRVHGAASRIGSTDMKHDQSSEISGLVAAIGVACVALLVVAA